MWAHFTDHLFIGDLLLPIYRDVSVVNNFKGFRPLYVLVAWSVTSFADTLAQLAQLFGVRRIPDILVFGMFPQLYLFKGLSRFFVHYKHCLV